MIRRRTPSLRIDRGATDPLLVVASMTVAVILSAVVASVLVQLVGLGSRVAEEQLTSATLSSASTAFARDAESATAVTVAGTQRVRFERSQPGSCRVSEWTTTGGELRNRAGTAASCAAATLAPVLTVSEYDGTITGKNAAGRSLVFTAAGAESGPVTGKPATVAASAWASKSPRSLAVSGNVELPVAGPREYQLRGLVWTGGSGPALPPGPVEDVPRSVPMTPTAPVISSVTRGATGLAYAGARESVLVVWSGAQCGPYAPSYTATWASGGVVRRATTSSTSAQLAPVPNGSLGSVTVAASCPATVPTTGATSSMARAYAQPLPKPAVTVTARTVENHVVSWLAVSSGPLTYSAEIRQGGAGAWSPLWNSGTVTDSPSGVQSITATVGQGSAYGRATEYRVTAKALAATSVSDPRGYTAAWPAIASPTVWTDQWGGAAPVNNRLLWGPRMVCPAGTSPQYLASVGGLGSWGWTTATTQALNPWWGSQYTGAVRQRCVSAWTSSPASAAGSTSWRVSMPTPPAPAIWITGGSQAPAALTVNVASTYCSSNGWQTGWLVNGIWRATNGAASHAITFYGQPAGTRSFSAQIACQAPSGAAGAYSAASGASRYVSNPPPPAAGMPGSGQIAYNVGTNRGCGWPGNYMPGPGVGMRVNAYQGSCYWQTQHPERDRWGDLTGRMLPWSPAAPGRYFAGAFRG